MNGSELTTDEILAQLDAYVLGALESDEMTAMVAYFAGQRQISERLIELDEAVVALAQSAPPVALPAAAKMDLLRRVQAERPARPVVPAASRPVAVDPDPRPTFIDWLRDFVRGRGVWTTATGLALVALMLLSIWTVQTSSQLGRVEAEVATLQADNEALATALTETESGLQTAKLDLIAAQSQIDDFGTDQVLLASVSAATEAVILHSEAGGDLPRGAVYMHDNRGQIVVHGLDPLPADQAYQLWLVRPDGNQVSVGLIDVKTKSEATWTDINIDPGAADYIAVGISIEPAGGSPLPTGSMLLQGESG